MSDMSVRDVLHTKASSPQGKNLAELSNLLKFFGDPPVEFESIEPVHARQHLDWRWTSSVQAKKETNSERVRNGKAPFEVTDKEGQVPPNREKALLSHIWNCARNKGLTKLPNHSAGIKGFREGATSTSRTPCTRSNSATYGRKPAPTLRTHLASAQPRRSWATRRRR